ncbi:MAG: hypothetical protein IKO10_18510 [Lachnospiraceae bacterium]|nr:hypothetical protein [Lachnospiraceae bacterium]
MDKENYDALVVVTSKDFDRMHMHHRRIAEDLPVRRVLFCGNEATGKALQREIEEGVFRGCEDRVGFIAEDEILSIAEVRSLWESLEREYLPEEERNKVGVGWYYQQFIKYAYSFICKDRFYLAWDGDTVPCKKFSMFSENGVPYFDYKREEHQEYFVTMERLLGLKKVMAPSFIAEHMLFRCDIVQELLREIEANPQIRGTIWWEKILYSIRPEKLFQNSFSEFETYGTYTALRHLDEYRLREWHSLRYAGFFFEIDQVEEKDWIWLGKDFGAISFEKGHQVRPDTANLMNNPRYQEKLSARQVLEIVQEEFEEDSLREIWDQ